MNLLQVHFTWSIRGLHEAGSRQGPLKEEIHEYSTFGHRQRPGSHTCDTRITLYRKNSPAGEGFPDGELPSATPEATTQQEKILVRGCRGDHRGGAHFQRLRPRPFAPGAASHHPGHADANGSGDQVTTTPGEQTPTPAPGVALGPQVCPTGVADPVYWNRVLHTPGTNGKVESVSFANMLGNSTLQALVTVRHSDANSTLDVYVFDQITSANPTQLFKLSGLIKGDAKISGYNSVLTAQVDQHSALNAGKPVAQWTPDLFREFAWNGERWRRWPSPASSPT